MKVNNGKGRIVSMVSTLVLCTLAVVSCAEMQARMGGKSPGAMASTDEMVEMAMLNMEKVMMMSPDQRQRYVMDQQENSLKNGRTLFADAGLGTNGFTCASCHPKGETTGASVPMGKMQMSIPSLVGVAGSFPKYKVPNNAVITLAEMNNNCVVMFMKGQPLPLGEQLARDLALYVTSLSQGEAVSPGKQSM